MEWYENVMLLSLHDYIDIMCIIESQIDDHGQIYSLTCCNCNGSAMACLYAYL